MLRTNVYVDGFNLYYGAVKNRPKAKWLDLSALCSILLTKNDIQQIRYFTARVQARSYSPNGPRNQAVYLRALRTIPNLSIHFGHFLSHPVRLPLNSNPVQKVEVIRTEEKGSDVNLATHLLWDGFQDDYECAVIISNDSDLVEPIRVVKCELGKSVGIICPHQRMSKELKPLADFVKTLRPSALHRAQFPPALRDAKGDFHRPPAWS